MAQQAFEQAIAFSQALDLSIDVHKTYAWSTCPHARGLLRTGGFRVVSDERDLGAHVVYTRQIRNMTLKNRIKGLSDFWGKLRSAGGSYLQRLRIVRTAAWPRALHGVSGSFLGKKHWENLRSEFLKGMNIAKAGVSPVVQFVIDGWTLDPLAYAVMATLRDFRDFGSNDTQLNMLGRAIRGEVTLPDGSVTSILLSRVALLGWLWVGEGIIKDVYGTCNVATCGMAELVFRAQRGWQQWVASQVSHRPSFRHFDKVDVDGTLRHLAKLQPVERATLRSYLNGMTFTNAQACYWTTSGCSNCPACGQPDSAWHRLYECSFSESCRKLVADDVLEAVQHVPQVLSVQGWTLLAPLAVPWMQYLAQLGCQLPVTRVQTQLEVLDLFTDGSCLNQEHGKLAAWAVVQASKPCVHAQPSDFAVLCAGKVPGCIQSAHRAELYAILAALHVSPKLRWSSQTVVGLRKCHRSF